MGYFVTLIAILVLTSSLLSVSVSASGGVGDACCDAYVCSNKTLCNIGLDCCFLRPWMPELGGTCYDFAVSTCANCPVANPIHPQTQLCPKASPTCCGDCIDNTKQCCHHYGTYDFFQCNADQTCCGFNNGQRTCCSSNQLCVNDVCVPKPTCPSGYLLCGSACYHPSQYVCGTYDVCYQTPSQYVCESRPILCPVANPSLCGDACYNQAQYRCVNGQLVPASNPTQGSTQGPTTGPTSSTPAPGCVIPGDVKCGTRCYSPTTHVCANPGSSFLCPVAFPLLCAADACYSNTQYTCVNGQLQPK